MQWSLLLRQLWFKDALLKVMQEGLMSLNVGVSLAVAVGVAHTGFPPDWEWWSWVRREPGQRCPAGPAHPALVSPGFRPFPPARAPREGVFSGPAFDFHS